MIRFYKKIQTSVAVLVAVGMLGVSLPVYAAGDSVTVNQTVVSQCGDSQIYVTGTATYAQVASPRYLVVKLDGVEKYVNPDRPTTWWTTLFPITVGNHTVTANIYRNSAHTDLAATNTWTLSIAGCSKGAGAGNGGGRSAEEEPLPAVLKPAIDGVSINGNIRYSSKKYADGKHNVVVLAANGSTATYKMKVSPLTKYALKITAKNDVPASVKALILIDGKPWKGAVWSKGDNSYEKKLIGQLNIPASGTVKIGVRFMNDSFTCTPAQIASKKIASCDRNLYLEKLELTPVF